MSSAGTNTRCSFAPSREFSEFRDFEVMEFDATSQEFALDGIREHKLEMQQKMKEFLTTTDCRRKLLLSCFEGRIVAQGTSAPSPENCCDNCRRKSAPSVSKPAAKAEEKREFGPEALRFFQAVRKLRGLYGMQMVILYLRGSKSKKIKEEWVHGEAFGSGRNQSERWWKAFGAMLKAGGYIIEQNFDHGFGHTLSLSGLAFRWLYRCIGSIPASLILNVSLELEEIEAEVTAKSHRKKGKNGHYNDDDDCIILD